MARLGETLLLPFVNRPSRGDARPQREAKGKAIGFRELLSWGVASGLVGSILLLAHLRFLAPGALSEIGLLGAIRLASVTMTLSSLVVLSSWCLVRLAGRRPAPRRLAPWAAAAVAVAPMATSWSLFGLWNGKSDTATLLAVAVIVLLATWLGEIAFSSVAGVVRWLSRPAAVLISVAALGHAVLAVNSRVSISTVVRGAVEKDEPVGVREPEGETASVVVLLTIDTLRADHLGVYGYSRETSPNIDRIADEGLVVESMLSASSGTIPSLATVHTGLDPWCHGVRDQKGRLDEGTPRLSESFRDAGYRTLAVVTNRLLRQRNGFAQGFDHFENLGDVVATQAVKRARALIESSGSGPVFLWLHFMDPHTPYVPEKRLFRSFLSDDLYSSRKLSTIDYGSYGGVKLSRVFGAEEADRAQVLEGDVVARYDGEIRAADLGVGQALAALAEIAPPRDTVVFMLADHGETLHRGPLDPVFQHALDVYQSTVRIPAILWAPGRVEPGTRLTTPAHQVDVMPTLLALAGIGENRDPGDPGVDLASAGEPGRRVLVTQTAWWDALSLKLLPSKWRQPSFAVFDGRHKLVVRPRSELRQVLGPKSWLHAWRTTVTGGFRDAELYDIEADPNETTDLSRSRPEKVSELNRALESYKTTYDLQPCRPAARDETDFDDDHALRALGYLD